MEYRTQQQASALLAFPNIMAPIATILVNAEFMVLAVMGFLEQASVVVVTDIWVPIAILVQVHQEVILGQDQQVVIPDQDQQVVIPDQDQQVVIPDQDQQVVILDQDQQVVILDQDLEEQDQTVVLKLFRPQNHLPVEK